MDKEEELKSYGEFVTIGKNGELINLEDKRFYDDIGAFENTSIISYYLWRYW